MKFSKEWLQSYIVNELPDDAIMDDTLSKKAFELEGIEIYKGVIDGQEYTDTVYDIKVLPNRHGDALSHYYTAKELCALFDFKLKDIREHIDNSLDNIKSADAGEHGDNIQIVNKNDCPVFESIRIDGVDNRETPLWMRRRLEAIGQKSINAIVDITNYVQFAINKPLHAYDAKNVRGGFIVRRAKSGEKLLTLDHKELELDVDTLVIADHERPLGLAGIKGGMYSGINNDTTNIILESANFNSVLIRQTSKKYNIRTDASKRFEAGQSDSLVPLGIDMAVELYKEVFGNDIVISNRNRSGEVVTDQKFIDISVDEINDALGTQYDVATICEALDRYDFKYTNSDNKNKFQIQIPSERVDLNIKVDIIEEIGRNIGYDHLITTVPALDRVGHYDTRMYIEMKCREYLSSQNYDETMTYTLTDKGDIQIVSNGSPIALRNDIATGLIQSYNKSIANAPLMELNVIRSYEIGSVFANQEERRHLAIVCDDGKKKSKYLEELDNIVKGLATHLGIDNLQYEIKSEKPAVVEIDLPSPPTNANEWPLPKAWGYDSAKRAVKEGEGAFLNIDHNKEFRYKHLSPYPIVTRDVACFYPEGQSVENLKNIINNTLIPNPSPSFGEGSHTNANLARKFYLVDQFDKTMDDGTVKHSAAFRIVYQSDDRTLTDEEVNIEVAKVYDALREVGCELR